MIDLSSFSFISLTNLGAIFLLFIGFFLTRYILLPYLKVRSYKKDGVTTHFFPILGIINYNRQALKESNDIMGRLKRISHTIREPKYFVTHLSRRTFIVLQDPQYIKEFLQKSNNFYHKGHSLDCLKVLAGTGLVGAEGETWKRHRRIVSSSFNFEFLKANISVIQNTTKELLGKLTPEDFQNYSAISKIQGITGEIVGRIFFGENLNSFTIEGKSLTLALADITSELSVFAKDPLVLIFGTSIMKLPLIPKFSKVYQSALNFRKVCFDIINERKLKPDSSHNDLLSSLLATQKLEDHEQRFSDEDIVDEFITFFTAGMDTTGHLVGMTLYNLTQYPELLQELQAERDQTYNLEKKLTTDTLTKMEVLHSVFKETLRFYTPAPLIFMRRATCDHELLDLKVSKGDLVVPAFVTPAFDEKYFEKPFQFNPARWINSEGKIDPYAFVPFSAGPRNCIGQHLAIMEAKVIVSEFLERFDFGLKDDGYKLKMTFRFLYEPEEELLLKLTPKNH